jgi:hypothetical protein
MNSLGVNPRIIRIYNDIRSGVPLYDVMKKISPKVAEKYKIDRNFKVTQLKSFSLLTCD